jgi:hypothetical protein
VLNRVENAVNACLTRGFHKSTRAICNCFQSFQHRTWTVSQMLQQHIIACQILSLCQWTEDRLEQGSVRAELAADETEAG